MGIGWKESHPLRVSDVISRTGSYHLQPSSRHDNWEAHVRRAHMWISTVLVLGVWIVIAGSACSTNGNNLDGRMSVLIARLGDSCESFDFLAKREIGGHAFRPANCEYKDSGDSRLMLFVFPSKGVLQEWIQQWDRTSSGLDDGQTLIVGEDWAAEVDSAEANRIAELLGGTE